MSIRNMTIPSRPAPPPPQAMSNSTTRYSPATNWDDTPFNPQSSTTAMNASRQAPFLGHTHASQKSKKAPPPRPPPPKVVPALKKPGQPQSINILSNLFGQKRNHAGPKPPIAQKGQIPVKLPPPPKLPPPLGHHGHNYGSTASTPSSSGHGSSNGTDFQLISFDSPPSSPTFTQKSCSDCISVDSFSSDSNYSSPNNGSMSQTESGFEDDFVSQNDTQRSNRTTPATTTTKDLWDFSDPFGMPPPSASTSKSSSSHNIYAPLSSATIRAPVVNSKLYESEFVDPLCNGKTVAPKVQTVAMPTIIKSSGNGSQKSSPALKPKPSVAPVHAVWATKPPAPLPTTFQNSNSFDDGEESLESLPSLPMPNIPPPPPPVCVAPASVPASLEEPYGIAMYDFSGETDDDLSFRTNDKIYILKRLDEEWLLGRNRRGCEGMFPANYIEVRVPLNGERLAAVSPSIGRGGDISPSGTDSFNHPQVRVLYTFNAEAPEDLTIAENEYVTVLHRINSEWLYGELYGRRGQFPANFIESIPPNLPLIPNVSGGN